jgi:hypothetical protein
VYNITFSLAPGKCRVRHEAPNLETEVVIMCCLVRAVAHLGGGIYGTGELTKLGEKLATVPLGPP